MLLEEIVGETAVNELVFVYGSLKRGYGNHQILANADFLGMGKTPPRFSMLDLGGYPGAVAGKDRLLGEVFQVTDQETMDRLDYLESNGSMYLRKKVPIMMNRRQVSAWLYVYLHPHPDDPMIESIGDIVTWPYDW